MSLPFGFRYLRNMALYLFKGLKETYIKDYGKDLKSRYDRADKTLYKEKVFCLDCLYYKNCKGKYWKRCPERAEALRKIRRKL
ncbi:hypothetical protein KAX08_00380 [candidate division WOR-3 bacterium]|nr:hypothetical protein [candidate division WOR-3 bacterium]